MSRELNAVQEGDPPFSVHQATKKPAAATTAPPRLAPLITGRLRGGWSEGLPSVTAVPGGFSVASRPEGGSVPVDRRMAGISLTSSGGRR